jgi:hypothetical protein
MANYKADTISFDELNKKIQAGSISYPKFQRSVVWNEKKIGGLISTIQKGYPFGSILLYKPEDENQKYKLIDGLQRYTAISKYLEAPFQYYPNFEEEFIVLKDSIKTHLEDKGVIINQELEQIFENLSLLIQRSNVSTSLTSLLTPFENTRFEDHSLVFLKEIEEFKKLIESRIEINNLVIPVIYFTGEESQLTEVFQRINEGGKPLTKYEIYASSWSDYNIYNFEDTEIINVLEQRYISLSEKIGNIDFDFEFENIEEINVFEYCFSLSKILSEIMFTAKDSDVIDTIGFSLITSCLGLQNSKMSEVGSKLHLWSNEKLNEFKEALKESTKIVIEHLVYKFSRNDELTKLPKDFLITSFISSVFRYKYEINDRVKCKDDFSENTLKDILKSIELEYLLDIFDNHWGSTGDKRLDQYIGLDGDKLKYLVKPSTEQIKRAFKGYLQNQNEKDSLASGRSHDNKVILQYILNNEIVKRGEIVSGDVKYDVEHIVTKEILKMSDIKLISPLCNLCFLPPYENRGKKGKIIYEFINDEKLYKIDETELSRLLYPSRAELAPIMENKNNLKYEIYLEFLQTRENCLTKSLEIAILEK